MPKAFWRTNAVLRQIKSEENTIRIPNNFWFEEILWNVFVQSVGQGLPAAQPTPWGPLAALNSDVKSCYQGGYSHKGGMIKLHPLSLCRWDPCNCQYHRDTILDQVWVVMLKMDRLCKHPNQEHLQKCGLGMVSNLHYCCCSHSERFPRNTVCKCLGQNCHFEMFLLDMEGIPIDLWLLAVFLDLVHILHTEKIPMVQWAWIGRYPPCRVDVFAVPAKHCRHGPTWYNVRTNINIPQPVLTVPSPIFKTQKQESCATMVHHELYNLFFYTSNINTAFPTLLWPNNQHQSAIRCLDPPRKETWKHGRISDRMCESDILLARGTLSRQHATSGIGSSWTSQAYTPVRTGKAKVIYHQPELVNTMQLHFFMQFCFQQKSELFFFWKDQYETYCSTK